MRIKRLEIENIRSYSNLDITFPEGSLLLSGNIGSGKTSILLGLQFALFGLQPGQKGTSLLKNGEDNAFARVYLEIDGEDITIERAIKKLKGGSLTQENNRIYYRENEEIISTSEMRTRVISLLGYPPEFSKKSDLLYKFTVYTPQEGMKEIIEEKTEIRLDLLRHIFGIERYKRIKENCTTLTQVLKDNIKTKDLTSQDIPLLKERITLERERKIKKVKENNDLQITLTNFHEEKSFLDKSLENIKKELEEKFVLEREFSKKESELGGKELLKNKLEKEIASLKDQLSNNISFKQESLDNINTLLLKHRQIREELDSKFIRINSKVSIIQSDKEKNIEKMDKVNSLENCPTCFQNVGIEHKEKIFKNARYNLETINRELDPLLFEIEQLKKDIERERELIFGYEQDKLRLEQDKIKFEGFRFVDTKLKSEIFALDNLNNEKRQIESDLVSLKERLRKFSDKETLFKLDTMKLEELLKKIRISEISFAENKREIEILAENIIKIEQELSNKEKIRADGNYLREILEWIETKFLNLVSHTERNVLIKIRRDFSRLFSEWFSMLVSDYLSVELDEDFTPMIYNKDYQMNYEFLSGGERTAVALAYRLALNQMINSVFSQIKTKDILILDEPTDGFSEQQLDKVRDILDQLNTKQIILVSHEQKIEGFVDSIIKVRKGDTSSVF